MIPGLPPTTGLVTVSTRVPDAAEDAAVMLKLYVVGAVVDGTV
jgi:hypothetical protein